MAVTFRFDESNHSYWLDGVEIPGISSMLALTDWVDDSWFTPESRDRGTEVHRLCTDLDLGALDLHGLDSPFKPYVLAYQQAMALLRPTWTAIEEPCVHEAQRWAGRPDRVGFVDGLATVLEIKSGAPARSHAVQLALQALFVSADGGLPLGCYQRLAVYLMPTGRFRVVKFSDPRDFREARRIISVCCEGVTV